MRCAGIRGFLARRALLGVLIVAWIPFIVRMVQFYLAANFSQTATVLGPSAQTFRDFLEQQNFFVFLVTIYIGAGLIAHDRRANALQIYLSKPLTRAEYIAGKMAILLVSSCALVTLVPALLLLIGQIVLSGSFAFARANLFLIPAITLYGTVEVLVVTFADARAVVAVDEQPLCRRCSSPARCSSPTRSSRRSAASPDRRRCRGCRSRRASRRSVT